MKVKMMVDGTLHITAETEVEAFALRTWDSNLHALHVDGEWPPKSITISGYPSGLSSGVFTVRSAEV